MTTNKFFLIAFDEILANKLKYILLLVFFIGQTIMSIAGIVLLPELLKSQGIPSNVFPQPTAALALAEVVDNFILMGIIAIVFATMQIFASEMENGVVYYSLARPITRQEYILGKIIGHSCIVALTTIIMLVFAAIYLQISFTNLPAINWIELVIPLTLVSLVIVSITAFLSTEFNSTTTGMLSVFIIIILFALPMVLWDVKTVSPFYLASQYSAIINNTFYPTREIGAMVSIICWVVIPVILAVLNFSRKDL